ncbi:hypothetical protein SGLAM104S_03746 [Streptomyces glaucescens]
MRRTVVPSVSLISMVRFWRAAFTAPLFRVSLIQLVNSLLWSSPRVIVISPACRPPGCLRMICLPSALTCLISTTSSSTVSPLISWIDSTR